MKTLIFCTMTEKKVKADVLNKNEKTIKVELPTGFIMTLARRGLNRTYVYRQGELEFYTDGKVVD